MDGESEEEKRDWRYFVKQEVLQAGSGSASPTMRSVCQIIVNTVTDDDVVNERLEEVLAIRLDEQVKVQLEGGFGDLSDIFDTILERMKTGEKTKFKVIVVDGFANIQANDTFSFVVTLVSFTQPKLVSELNFNEYFELAAGYKKKGTKVFKESRLHIAATFYTKAVVHLYGCLKLPLVDWQRKKVNDLKYACHLNLAACQLNCQLPAFVVLNCTLALEIQPCSVKALFRRATGHLQLKDFDKAELDIKSALELEPQNGAIQALRRKVKQEKRRADLELGMKLSVLFISRQIPN